MTKGLTYIIFDTQEVNVMTALSNKSGHTIQVMEKPQSKIIPKIAKMVKRVADHRTIEEIIHLTEEEQGID